MSKCLASGCCGSSRCADALLTRACADAEFVLPLQLYFGKTIDQGSVDLVPEDAQLAY
jgi:hypothetical protein